MKMEFLKKKLYNKNDMNDYKFSQAVTANNVRRGSFIDLSCLV